MPTFILNLLKLRNKEKRGFYICIATKIDVFKISIIIAPEKKQEGGKKEEKKYFVCCYFPHC